MKQHLHIWIAVLGLLLVIPAAWTIISAPLRIDETQAVFDPLTAVPLAMIKAKGSLDLTVTAPNTAAWARIRRTWGDPGYLITTVASGRKRVYCFDKLGLVIEAEIDSEHLRLTAADEPPYGYSADCQAFGLRFQAPPGSIVHIHARTKGERDMPSGQLIVAGYWTGATKDRLVGLMLNEDLRRLFNVLAVGGIAALGGAAWLVRRRRRANTRAIYLL